MFTKSSSASPKDGTAKIIKITKKKALSQRGCIKRWDARRMVKMNTAATFRL